MGDIGEVRGVVGVAGGGLPLPEYFNEKIKELTNRQPPGVGISINMLYLNAHLNYYS